MTVYDKNGQPYDADLVAGEEFRALQQQNAELRKLNRDVTRGWSSQVWGLRNEASLVASMAQALAVRADRLAGRGPAEPIT